MSNLLGFKHPRIIVLGHFKVLLNGLKTAFAPFFLVLSLLAPGEVFSDASPPTHPFELPLTVVVALKKLPPRPSGELVGEIFHCDPYCESVGKIFIAKAGTSPNGFRVEMDKTAKAYPAASQLKILVDPVQKSRMEASTTHEAEPDEGSVTGDPTLHSKPRTNMRWLFGFGVDVQGGARSVTTDSNTDTQTDTKVRPLLGVNFNLQANDFSTLGVGRLSARAIAGYRDGISEKSSADVSGRTASSQIGDIQFGLLWQRPRSKWHYGFLLEAQLRNFSTDPNTASGFSSTGLFISPGMEVGYRLHSLKILRSILGSVSDVDQYRGTSVSGTITQVQVRSCQALGDVIDADFLVCGIGGVDLGAYDGSGPPIRAVFTSSPHYSSTEWKIGFELAVGGIPL